MKPVLNIITITKDDLEGVAATVESTRRLRLGAGVKQTIIDGSCDQIRRAVQGLVALEENLDYHWVEANGIAAAFNHAINLSDAPWLWFLNGKDEAAPELDREFLLQVLEHSRADLIICNITFMQTGTVHTPPPLWALWPPLYWVPHQGTLLKRSLFERYGLFDERYKIAMDSELWIRVFSGSTAIDMLSVVIARYDENGVSNTETDKVVREVDRYVFRNYKKLVKIWLLQGVYLLRVVKRYFKR